MALHGKLWDSPLISHASRASFPPGGSLRNFAFPLRGRWIAKGETDEVFFIPQETVKNLFYFQARSSSALAICSAVGGQPMTQVEAPLQHLPTPKPSKVLPWKPWPMQISTFSP